jgi:hypothetical protein
MITASLVNPVQADDRAASYPSMAPIEQYRMQRDAEIALARTAAPESISHDAEIMVLGEHTYEIAVEGKNGFVCIVQRSWTAGTDDPDFWNPKLRAPICYNPAAARTYLRYMIKRTEIVLASHSKDEMAKSIEAGIAKKELPAVESGAMCYMLSKQQYLGDHFTHWHPHLMFFLPPTDPATWGTEAKDSPIIGVKDDLDRLTVFLVPVGKWSDGTPDSAMR